MTEEGNCKTCSFDVCSQCKTICCKDACPPLTKKRKSIIENHLKKQKIALNPPFEKGDYSYPAVDELGFCRFFDKQSGRCIIHLVKPETCVAGPITFDINSKNKRIEWYLKKPEICCLAGKLYENKKAFTDHFEIAKVELTNLICHLTADELRAIVKIEEPQTFKINESNLPLEVAKKLGLE